MNKSLEDLIEKFMLDILIKFFEKKNVKKTPRGTPEQIFGWISHEMTEWFPKESLDKIFKSTFRSISEESIFKEYLEKYPMTFVEKLHKFLKTFF